MTLGRQIAETRKERGLSQEQVEARVIALGLRDDVGKPLTLSTAALSRFEAGQRMPNIRSMQALSAALGVSFLVHRDGIEIVELEREEAKAG